MAHSSDRKGVGPGTLLMQKLIGVLRAHGICRIVGTVLESTGRTLSLAHERGFKVGQAFVGVHAVSLALQADDEHGGPQQATRS